MSGLGNTHKEELKEKALMQELQTLDNGSQNKAALTSEEKTTAILAQILSLFGFIAPLVVYLVEKDKMPKRHFAVEHAKSALNWQISYIIYFIPAWLLCFIFIGFLILIPLMIFNFIIIIVATIKASNGEYFNYPLAIKFIS